MVDEPNETIANLQQRITTLARRLRLRETQIAVYGIDVPPYIVLDKEEAARELRRTRAELRRMRPGPPVERTPYLGLLTFQEADTDRFFGRDMLVAELVEKASRTPFLAVLGPSGSGKSSVVRAGLVPMLKGGALPGSEHWRYLMLKPGVRPLDMLATELTKLQGGNLSDVLTLRQQLAETDPALLLVAGLLLDRATDQRLVLVIDQAEELWTLAPTEPEACAAFVNDQQGPFIDQLLAAAATPDAPLLIIMTMRADFLHRAAEHHILARAIGEHIVIVSPMAPAELRDAIERPVEVADGGFEPGLVDELIAQTVGREGALPLLEYTLLELWNHRRSDGTLTWDSFRALGGVEGALVQTADKILVRYTSEQRDELRTILLRLIQPGEGASDTRRRIALTDLAPAGGSVEAVQALLAPLVDARLLVVTATNDDPSVYHSSVVVPPTSAQVEIAHEALIRSWPTLRSWVDVARADLHFQIQFEEDSKEWESSGRKSDFLLSGLRLANAEAWINRTYPRLNTRDHAFLDASRMQDNARIAEKTAAAQRLRRRAQYLAGALLAALLAVVVAVIGFTQANERTRQAQRQGLASAAQSALVRGEPDQALALALAAITKAPGTVPDEAIAAIYRAAYTGTRRLLTGHTDIVYSVAFSPDGTRALSGSRDNTLRLWDVATGQQLRQFNGHTSFVWSVAFSPDGTRALSGSEDGTLRLWDLATGQELRTFTGHTAGVLSVAFSPDGTHALSGSWDKTLRLWDVATGQELRIFTDHTDGVWSVAFSPDSTRALSGSDDKTLRLWDLATGQELRQFRGHTGQVRSVAFSPDGRTALSGSDDKTLRLWDLATGQELRIFTDHTSTVWSVVFSPDGTRALSGSEDQTLRLWQMDTLADLIAFVRANGYVPELPCAQRILYDVAPLCPATEAAQPTATSQRLTQPTEPSQLYPGPMQPTILSQSYPEPTLSTATPKP